MTKVRNSLLLSSCVTIAALPGHAVALTTSTASVICSSTTKLQPKIDAVAAGTVATFNVSGTCNENIVVPAGKTIIIKGTTSAKITPSNASLPALMSYGSTTVQGMIISNASGTAEALVETDRGGSLEIVASDLSAPSVGSVVAAWLGYVRVTNSRVIGGKDDAVEVWGASDVVVKGDPALPVGPTAKYESYLKSPGSGISCASGGTLHVRAAVAGTSSGLVTIEQSRYGISASRCDFTVWNESSVKTNLRIRNNETGIWLYEQAQGSVGNVSITGNTSNGISMGMSDLSLSTSEVTGNGIGLSANQSRVAIGGVLFNNTSADVQAGDMTSMNLFGWRGQSSFPKALTWDNSFNCWNGSRIDIDTGAVVESLGTHYDFRGCVFQN